MAKLISKTYGEALFELALEEDKIDVFCEEIQAVITALTENAEFDSLMNHPKIVKEEKVQIMETVFHNRISEELVGFLSLIIVKDRYGSIMDILQYFLKEVKECKKIGVAYVTTAIALREEQKEQIIQKLLETTPYEQMEMSYEVDSTLIGGMVIRIGDRVVDSSILTQLNKLQKQLLKIQIA